MDIIYFLYDNRFRLCVMKGDDGRSIYGLLKDVLESNGSHANQCRSTSSCLHVQDVGDIFALNRSLLVSYSRGTISNYDI